MSDVLVIGAGPAGLMAAETLSAAGHKVALAEAKPTVGRKFLMAGKSGLNLTRDEPFDDFLANFGSSAARLEPMLRAFSNRHVSDWAEGLGQPVFTGSTGRVFPRAKKASPLLRAWLRRLEGQGVAVRTRWRWRGWQADDLLFDTPEGLVPLRPDATVLALGGASWSRLGSDGAWADWLRSKGVAVSPFAPSNAGLAVDWSDHMAAHFGAPVKGVTLSAGGQRSRGEFVISRAGLEGGGIYALTVPLRSGAGLRLDLLPDWPLEKVARRLGRGRGKETLTNHLRKALNLSPAALALLQEFGRPLPEAGALAPLIKELPITYTGLRPLDEAISTAGGLAWDELDEGLMIRKLPGVFATGEMLDWEAPTGGYLISASLATGRWAGARAADLLA